MSQFFRYWGPVCIYAGYMFYLSSQSHPDEDLPTLFKLFSDKMLHVMEYSVLGGLCYRAFRWGANDVWRQRAVPLAILVASLYGVSDEIHQAFVPFRESSVYDWLADIVGATIGAMAMRRILDLSPVGSVPEAMGPR